MDVEQLKIILDGVKSVSGDAASVAYWWVVLSFVSNLFGKAVIFGLGTIVVYLLVRVVIAISWSVNRIELLGSQLGIQDFYSPFNGIDRMKLNDAIEKLLSEREKKSSR